MYKYDLRKHVICEHNNSVISFRSKEECNECDYTTYDKQSVKVRINGVHKKEKRYICNKCDYKTYHNSSFKEHQLAVHGNQKFQCLKCPKTFGCSSNLRKHIRTTDDASSFANAAPSYALKYPCFLLNPFSTNIGNLPIFDEKNV